MDQPDIEQRWRHDGWLHLPSFFTAEEIGRINDDVARMWESRPRGVTVDDLDTGRRCRMSALAASDRRHRVKISDLYLVSPAIREILLAPKLIGLLRPLLDEEPVLCNSLNLEKSSEQDNHVDRIYMTPLTAGKLVAIWIALEDIHLDAGPLRLFPGSHQVPPYTFSDGSRHSIDAEMRQWGAAMRVELDRRGLQPVAVPAAAGPDRLALRPPARRGADPRPGCHPQKHGRPLLFPLGQPPPRLPPEEAERRLVDRPPPAAGGYAVAPPEPGRAEGGQAAGAAPLARRWNGVARAAPPRRRIRSPAVPRSWDVCPAPPSPSSSGSG